MTGAERRARLAEARLYLCTDSRDVRGDLAGFLDAALDGGVDVVQLREKGLEAQAEMHRASRFVEACQAHRALFSVNDRADIAATVACDVLHLGQGDLPVADARRLVGPDLLVGVSTHAEAEVDAAIANPDVDYFCVGPVWPTPTKPGRPAPGLGLIRYAAATGTAKPWFAIGGIDLETVGPVTEAGASRVVVVRVLTESTDPRAAAAALRERLASR